MPQWQYWPLGPCNGLFSNPHVTETSCLPQLMPVSFVSLLQIYKSCPSFDASFSAGSKNRSVLWTRRLEFVGYTDLLFCTFLNCAHTVESPMKARHVAQPAFVHNHKSNALVKLNFHTDDVAYFPGHQKGFSTETCPCHSSAGKTYRDQAPHPNTLLKRSTLSCHAVTYYSWQHGWGTPALSRRLLVVCLVVQQEIPGDTMLALTVESGLYTIVFR